MNLFESFESSVVRIRYFGDSVHGFDYRVEGPVELKPGKICLAACQTGCIAIVPVVHQQNQIKYIKVFRLELARAMVQINSMASCNLSGHGMRQVALMLIGCAGRVYKHAGLQLLVPEQCTKDALCGGRPADIAVTNE